MSNKLENNELVSILLSNSNIAAYSIISETGTITETRFTNLSAIGRLMKENSDASRIEKVFEIKDWSSVLEEARAGKAAGPFPVRREFNSILSDAAYFSSFPDYSCRVLSLAGKAVLVLIHYRRRFPLPDNSESFFFDQNNRIVALNRPFFSLLSKSFLKPEDVLGRSVDELFRETPKQLSLAALRSQDGEVVESRRTEWLGATGWKGLLFSDPGVISRDREALRVDNAGNDFSLITPDEEVDFDEARVTLRLDYGLSGDPLPVIFFGARGYLEDRVLTPDASGFSIGPDGSNRNLLLKKAGALVAAEPLPQISGKALHVLEISLFKNAIQCRLDNATVFSFHAFDTFLGRRGFLNLGVRPGRRFELRGMALTRETIRSTAGPRSKEFLLEFNDIPNRFFSISFLSSTGFGEGTLLARGIELREVTDMQNRIAFEQENARRLHQKIREQSARGAATGFVGSGEAVRRLLDTAEVLARANVTVLLQGPTGSGKEVLARHIHGRSDVFDQPFVKMDCSTLPRDLFESVVFGHVKGAFTGAVSDSEGLLESAGNGTLFIDEIQNLSFAAQAKLLAVLQDRRATRVGDSRPREIPARFIIGTNVDLEACIKEGSFREDLYYRINQASLFLPALKDRKEDIPELCRHFISQYNLENNARIKDLEPACLSLLTERPWPGNVRELKNVITKACIFSVDGKIGAKLLRENIPSRTTALEADLAEDRVTRARLTVALKEAGGKAVKAAELLGISRSSVYYNLKRYGMNPRDYN